MKILLSAIVTMLLVTQATIYGFVVDDANGSEIEFNQFAGKKILIVNIATGSTRVNQLNELQQLQDQYADSLIVIAFPSNSFGQESKSNTEIHQFCNAIGVNFKIAAKGDVKGANAQAIYQWLTKMDQNQVTNSEVLGDFQKYLIDSKGELMGIFAGSVSPLDNQIIASINYHN